MEERVLRVLAVWEDWSLFPATYLAGLEAFFCMQESDLVSINEHAVEASEAGEEYEYGD